MRLKHGGGGSAQEIVVVVVVGWLGLELVVTPTASLARFRCAVGWMLSPLPACQGPPAMKHLLGTASDTLPTLETSSSTHSAWPDTLSYIHPQCHCQPLHMLRRVDRARDGPSESRGGGAGHVTAATAGRAALSATA